MAESLYVWRCQEHGLIDAYRVSTEDECLLITADGFPCLGAVERIEVIPLKDAQDSFCKHDYAITWAEARLSTATPHMTQEELLGVIATVRERLRSALAVWEER